ncbi:MAG TPA: hypothetical protein PKC49_15820 [Phycisphaerae bacterium]|nr:hypothetical protein [Phycisphaerae bacterium]
MSVSPAAPVPAGARAAVRERFEGGDVQVRHMHGPIGPRKRDEEPALHENHEVGIPDIVIVAAREPHPERLERLALDEVAKLFDCHDAMILR